MLKIDICWSWSLTSEHSWGRILLMKLIVDYSKTHKICLSSSQPFESLLWIHKIIPWKTSLPLKLREKLNLDKLTFFYVPILFIGNYRLRPELQLKYVKNANEVAKISKSIILRRHDIRWTTLAGQQIEQSSDCWALDRSIRYDFPLCFIRELFLSLRIYCLIWY